MTPSQQRILGWLAKGPRPYEELPYAPNLDWALDDLFHRGLVVRVYSEIHPMKYSLPVKPPKDTELTKVINHGPKYLVKNPLKPRRKCRVCGRACPRAAFVYCSSGCRIQARRKPRPGCARCGKKTPKAGYKYCSLVCCNADKIKTWKAEEKLKRGSGMAGRHATSLEHVNGKTSSGGDSPGRPGDGEIHQGAIC